MKFLPNWRQAWRWFSMQALAAIIVIPMVWSMLPADVKAYVPHDWQPWILVLIAAAGIVGRVIDQNKASSA